MGRIKTDLVKRTASKILQSNPQKFSKLFTKNKESLAELVEVRSKKMRNLLAGHIVRLKSNEEKQASGTRRRRSSEDEYPGMGRRPFGRNREFKPRREEY
jgi:ribosomal protein S17E